MSKRGWIGALGIALLTTSGCLQLPAPVPATQRLTPEQDKKVMACQKAVVRGTSRFTAGAARHLTTCGMRAVALRVDEDRRLDTMTEPEIIERRGKLITSCQVLFQKVGRLSTEYIDGIVKACEPVEDLVLTDATRGDPLSFRALLAYLEPLAGNITLDDIGQVAGTMCSNQAETVMEMVNYQVPRISDASSTFANSSVEDLNYYVKTFLDPRCG